MKKVVRRSDLFHVEWAERRVFTFQTTTSTSTTTTTTTFRGVKEWRSLFSKGIKTTERKRKQTSSPLSLLLSLPSKRIVRGMKRKDREWGNNAKGTRWRLENTTIGNSPSSPQWRPSSSDADDVSNISLNGGQRTSWEGK